jgi:hypothetical protein
VIDGFETERPLITSVKFHLRERERDRDRDRDGFLLK